jgi:adenylate cyclase
VRPTTVRRHRFRRAVERGDPRLGLFVGAAASLVVAVIFARPEWIGLVHRLELAALDLGFKTRAPIAESSRFAVIDMDDNTFKKLRYPLPRKRYGQAILALDRLGARQIVFDVQFKMRIPETKDYDPDTGEFRLDADDAILRTAIAKAGNVRLAYHVELNDVLGGLRPDLEKLKAVFAKSIAATLEEAVRATGVSKDQLEGVFEAAREEAVVALVADRMALKPDLAFATLKKEFFPEYQPGSQRRDLHLLHYAYWLWKARALMEAKSSLMGVTGLPPAARRGLDVTPPAYKFLEVASGVGCANAESDLTDGVLRRPWAALLFGGVPHPYLGLAAAVRDKGSVATIEMMSDRLVIRGPDDEVSIPLDDEGRILVNWAGNLRGRKREATYIHVPFPVLVRYYESCYEDLDGNLREFILKEAEEDRSETDKEYLALSERLRSVLQGEREIRPEEMRSIEARMAAIRDEIAAGMEKSIAALDKRLATLTAPRARKEAEGVRATFLTKLSSLRGLREQETELRKLVEGRICFIGSTGTAGGDLHACPIQGSTPGVDAHVNIANMVLTGQAIRRAPAWAALLYLLAVGFGVSVGVAHWNATWSSIFTAGVVAATVGVFYTLFSGASFWVPGAGPIATALIAFASVTAFKELVTQKSKRKLQRELEKSTSPELVKILMEHPEYLSEPRKMRGTFFFSDVKSFTSISEKMAAEVLFPFINRYLDRMTRALKARRAYLDKYIGDGIMALFGVPVSSPDHARNACLAALECQAALAQLNAEFALEGHPQLKSRIGLNSGEVSAGYMGGAERSDYSVLGDAVNLAARLEGANKEYGTSIMLSDSTRELIGNGFVVRELDRIRVVGKREPTVVFELIAQTSAPLPFPAAYLEAYDGALKAYRERRWGKAIDGFRAALALRPDDKASEVYIDRCEAFQENPPSGDWDGVFELTSK